MKRRARVQEQKDRREERASQKVVLEERLQWEASEEVVDDDLMLALALSQSADEHASTLSSASSTTLMPMREEELAAWERVNTLKRALKESSRKSKVLELQLEHAEQALAQQHPPTPSPSPFSGTLIRIDQHKRRKGTKLTEAERRAVLHCYEVCHEEKRKGASVSTVDPFLRTAVYFGISQNTVRDAVAGKNLEDRRVRPRHMPVDAQGSRTGDHSQDNV